MRLVVDLTLPTDARLISQTRRMFSGYLAELGVANDDVHDVALALAEACTNVMRHAYDDPDHQCLHLTAELRPEEVVLVVEDDGSGIPHGAGECMPEPGATSGRGLQIIRELMTSVDVETTPERAGTRVWMRKSLRAADLTAPA
ncbi:MAG TPA: ATP-binding protein [Acidimicrobiales bacterium]|nr:ATP-binding protein [Acidimicrobiales bacterium]